MKEIIHAPTDKKVDKDSMKTIITGKGIQTIRTFGEESRYD